MYKEDFAILDRRGRERNFTVSVNTDGDTIIWVAQRGVGRPAFVYVPAGESLRERLADQGFSLVLRMDD